MNPQPSRHRDEHASTLAASGYAPLAAREPVWIHRSSCLRLRLHSGQCRACAEACPVGAVTAVPGALALSFTCTGCGRCQAACPTGALRVAGFGTELTALGSSPRVDSVLVDCARIGSTPDAAGVRVPCLGGLTEGQLLSLCAGAPDRTVVLADRGACASCDSGAGAQHPAARVLHRVAALMREAGVPDARLPRIETRGAGADAKAAFGEDPLQVHGRARRRFFTAVPRPAIERSKSDARLGPVSPSRERQAVIGALTSLAARHGGRVAPSLFHRVEAGPACRGHRVCASACPTGALVRWRDDGAAAMGIAFDSSACVGCGHCAAVCPEQALQVHRGTGGASTGPRPLTRFAQRACADCGARFASTADAAETRCERCRKSAQLARAAFATLFPARP